MEGCTREKGHSGTSFCAQYAVRDPWHRPHTRLGILCWGHVLAVSAARPLSKKHDVVVSYNGPGPSCPSLPPSTVGVCDQGIMGQIAPFRWTRPESECGCWGWGGGRLGEAAMPWDGVYGIVRRSGNCKHGTWGWGYGKEPRQMGSTPAGAQQVYTASHMAK